MLRWEDSVCATLLALLASFLLAFLTPYWAGARGNKLLWVPLLLMMPVASVLGALKAFLLGMKLHVLADPSDGTILHLSEPSDPRAKGSPDANP